MTDKAEERAREYAAQNAQGCCGGGVAECHFCRLRIAAFTAGQFKPNAAAVARVLGEATLAKGYIQNATHGVKGATGKPVWSEMHIRNVEPDALTEWIGKDVLIIEAMIPEPEPKEAGDEV